MCAFEPDWDDPQAAPAREIPPDCGPLGPIWALSEPRDPVGPVLHLLCLVGPGSPAREAVWEGALMAKLDLRSTYCMVPVHPSDQWLLGITWGSVTPTWTGPCHSDSGQPRKYIMLLPTGLRGLWSVRGFPIPSTTWMISFCEKVEGPESSLTFLGIEIDSVAHQLRLPAIKLQ